MYCYLNGIVTEKAEIETDICLTPQMATKATGHLLGQEPESPFGSPGWVSGTQAPV